jgi:serine/threonine-protein kinase
VTSTGTAGGDGVTGERYRLDEPIGRGGMATVWRATDTVLNRPVAIKRLHAGLLADRELSERFRREALLVARLSHPNLVHLLDRGEDPNGPYLVMELVDGEDLKTRLRREGALDPQEAARICAEVGRGLAYAHAQGVVHRDIKAQNVLLTRDGGVKLTDFGIARLMEADAQPGLTSTDMLVGSADYLSPEQADGRPLDARTDVYSLGIVLYECLTGELPFKGEGFVAVAMKQCNEPMPDPRRLSPEVPPWLAACALRAGEKDPDRRYPDAARMVAALAGGGDRDGAGGTAVLPALPDVPPPPPSGAEPPGDGVSDDQPTEERRRRRRAMPVVLAVLVLVAAVAAVLAVLRETGGDDGAAPAAAATTLRLSTIQDYDPESTDPNDQTEMHDLRGLAIDGDPTTAWETERYRDRPDFAGLKSGVGLLMGLPAPATASELVVSSPTPGVRFQVLGPLVGGKRELLGEGTFTGEEQTVPLKAAPPSTAYLLWITSLVPDGEGRYWAEVGEVGLRGVPNST